MLRRATILAALVVMLGASLGMAGDVKVQTWSASHLKRSDTATTSTIGVAGFQSFRVVVDEVVGDTLATDSIIIAIQTRIDNNNDNDNPWISAYTKAAVDADSTAFPVEIAFKGDVDSLMWDQLRVQILPCLTCDTAWTDSGAAADSGFATFLIRLIATKF